MTTGSRSGAHGFGRLVGAALVLVGVLAVAAPQIGSAGTSGRVLGDGIQQIAVAERHACALFADASVACWGANDLGQLGLGDTATRGDQPGEMGASLPLVDLGPGADPVALSTSATHTCALRADGTISCWGGNADGELGIGDTAGRGDQPGELGVATPVVDLGPGVTAIDVVVGYAFSCALLADGHVSCWGANGEGQLGLGDTLARGDAAGELGAALGRVDLGAGRYAIQITAGAAHACALLDDGGVLCWGRGAHGALGQGSTENLGDASGELGATLPAVDLGTDRTALTVAAGANHTCVVLDRHDVKCWGAGASGALGVGSTADLGDDPSELGEALPVVNLGSRTADSIHAAGARTCAVLDNGVATCWGDNQLGQAGIGSTADVGDAPGELGAALVTVNLGTGAKVTNLGVGPHTACALLAVGSVKCWGANDSGELGSGDTVRRGESSSRLGDALPTVDLGTHAGTASVTASAGHSCVLSTQAIVKCWGQNLYGQLGQGDVKARGDNAGEMGDALAPVTLGAGVVPVQIVAGGYHTCALMADGRVKCWGQNTYGQLGLGNSANRGNHANEMGDALAFVDLGSNNTAIQLVAGVYHTCALLNDGRVKCWGRSGSGQLGLGTTQSLGNDANEMGDRLPAVDLGTGAVARQLSSGEGHTCAVLGDGSVKCWGLNSTGQLGLGDKTARGDALGEMGELLPVVELGLDLTAREVAAGKSHTCALLTNGAVKCWGSSGSGNLGYGDALTRGDGPDEMGDLLPEVDLGSGVAVRQLVNGGLGSCALLAGGGVKCWGAGTSGRLGTGATDHRGDAPGEMGDALAVVDLGPGIWPARLAVSNHSCVIATDASVRCWGLNADGQLGTGDTASIGDTAGEMGAALRPVVLVSPPEPPTPTTVPPATTAPTTVPPATATTAAPTPGTAVSVPSAFSAGVPGRLFDTRTGAGGVPVAKVGTADGAGAPLEFRILGVNGVPTSGVEAVSLNVTATNTVGTGYLTVYPCGARPETSTLNFTAGRTVANVVTAPVSANGTVCFHVRGTADLLADVSGWYLSGNGYHALAPNRLFDTRSGVGGVAVGRLGNPSGTAPALQFTVAGTNGVPSSGAASVVMNLTITDATSGGYVTVFPCGAKPNTSNLNFSVGQTVANLVNAPLSANGTVCFSVVGNADVFADVSGWYAGGAGITTLTPERLFDTRSGEGGVPTARVGAPDGSGAPLRFHVAGTHGIPSTGVGAVSLNLTATNASGTGYVTVYPCGERPATSTLNFGNGDTVANALTTPVSHDGDICLYVYGIADVLADVNAWFPG